MVLNRDEFSGSTVESAVDNQRQLAKFESRENDRCLRELWREKSNIRVSLPGIMMGTGIVSTRSCKCGSGKGATFCGNRDVQVGQSVLAGGNKIHIDWEVVPGITEFFYD